MKHIQALKAMFKFGKSDKQKAEVAFICIEHSNTALSHRFVGRNGSTVSLIGQDVLCVAVPMEKYPGR